MMLGFVGLGRMGGAMAGRLVAAGHALIAHDVDPAAVEALEIQGGRGAASTRAVGDAAEIVFVSLPGPDVVLRSVLGDGGIGSGRKVRIVVDLSTSGPLVARALAEGLAARDIASVEAPVSGGAKGAREGLLTAMVSGPAAARKQVMPLLATFGRAIDMGDLPGAGQTMKLVNSLLAATAVAVTAEGMALGIKAGLDPRRMIEVLNASTGRNSATEDKWPQAVLPRSFDFGFETGLSLGDLRLCLATAEAAGVPLSVGSATQAIMERTALRYGPHADFTTAAKLVEADAGLDPERAA